MTQIKKFKDYLTRVKTGRITENEQLVGNVPDRPLDMVAAGEVIKLQKPQTDAFINVVTNNDGVDIGDCSVCGAPGVLIKDHICKTVLDTSVPPGVANELRHVTVVYGDGTKIQTDINGTDDEIKKYFIGKWFNLGNGRVMGDGSYGDNMQKAVDVIINENLADNKLYSSTKNYLNLKEGDKVTTILGPFADTKREKYYGVVDAAMPNELYITFYDINTNRKVSGSTQYVYDYVSRFDKTTNENLADSDVEIKRQKKAELIVQRNDAIMNGDMQEADRLLKIITNINGELMEMGVQENTEYAKNFENVNNIKKNFFDNIRSRYGVNESKMITKIEWFKSIMESPETDPKGSGLSLNATEVENEAERLFSRYNDSTQLVDDIKNTHENYATTDADDATYYALDYVYEHENIADSVWSAVKPVLFGMFKKFIQEL